MTDTKQKEVWKTYPEYPWIEVSNLGNVRTKDRIVTDRNGKKYHIKGQVLKQQLNKRGYLFVRFNVNGRGVNRYVHRMVAITFIPNPNNYPEVNHIDNNPTNNSASNLEWCTDQYNQDYKKNFGTSPAEVFGHPVFAVNLETGKVSRFESQSEAARKLGVYVENINKVVKGKLIQTGGYWFTEDESKITEENIQEIKDKMRRSGGVVAVNLETSEVFWFETQTEAAQQLGVYKGNICSVLKGRYSQTGNYWFCYADDTAVEKTREKFGDDIARKVEELIGENHDYRN